MQWHQLDHMRTICTSLQTDNHTNTSSLIFPGRMLFMTPNQQMQMMAYQIICQITRSQEIVNCQYMILASSLKARSHIRCALLRVGARETVTQCISVMAFTHTLSWALVRRAGENASCVLIAQCAQRAVNV